MSDEAIIELYRSGSEEKAFNEIVRKYSERLYFHIRNFAGAHEEADDLLQDTFIKIWKALPQFRGDARLYTWIYRIATNEVLNYLRKKRLKYVFSFTSEQKDYVSRLEADPYFNGDQAQKRLLIAVSKLPEIQRLVFMMRYFEEMEYKDISEILNSTVGSLKASYHHAYMKIKKELSEEI